MLVQVLNYVKKQGIVSTQQMARFFRMDEDVPLIVPEVNPNHISEFKKKNIIANPNCSTIQMVTALNPLHKEFKIKKVFVSTYQAVSGAGKAAMDELFNQTKGIFSNPMLKVVVVMYQHINNNISGLLL